MAAGQAAGSVGQASEPAAEPPRRRSYGREALEGETVKIIELQPDETALICGEVISTEEKITKDGKNTIFTMAVTRLHLYGALPSLL